MSGPKKIRRDAFLYLDGKNGTFAQCGSCAFGKSACGLMGNKEVSSKNGSCCLYVPGRTTGRIVAFMTRAEVGYVERQVRCEHCKFFASQVCVLYRILNREHPSLFDLDEKVDRYGCCNANTPG